MERRQAADGRQYTMQEFQDHYGATWEWRWQRAHRASGDPSGLPLSAPPSSTPERADAETLCGTTISRAHDHAEAPPMQPPPTGPQPGDAETLLAGPHASGLADSRAVGSLPNGEEEHRRGRSPTPRPRPTRPPPTDPQPRDAETLLAEPHASNLGGSPAAGSRDDDRPATFGPQGDVGTAPMQAPPTGGATGAETPGEEPRAEAPIVLVSLSSHEPPLPDGLNTIRCSCRRGCRRRCPVGRRIPCLACLSPVGPCCGVVAHYPLQVNQGSRLDIVVCHACLRPMEPAGCQ